jgi:glycosyltransferase involved in cell wall biosynthesis
MSHPRVSVVIPCYNREGAVRAAVQSVLDQTFTDFEVIAVDDGSTDDTVRVLLQIEDPRLQVLTQEANRGVSAARNRGIAAAKARWVAFQDSDDAWHPDKLARQIALLEAPGAAYVAAYCGMEIEEAGGTRYVPRRDLRHRDANVLPELVWRSFISTQTLIVRRDILVELGGFDEDLEALVDWELMLRVAQRGPVGLVDEPLVRQRFSVNSITRDPLRRVEARTLLVAKHADLIDRYAGAMAEHHYQLSGGFRICGKLDLAARHMIEARRREPWNARWWLTALWLRALRLARHRSNFRAT